MKKPFLDLKNVSTFLIMITVEISQLINSSTPSEPSVLKTKPNKLLTLFKLHQMLKKWISQLSLKFLDLLENKIVKPHSVNFLNFSTSTKTELLVQKNSKKSPKALDKISVLPKLIKWSTMPIKTEMELLTLKNSLTSSPNNIQKYDLYSIYCLFHYFY